MLLFTLDVSYLRLIHYGLSETQALVITEAFKVVNGETEVGTKANIRELELKFKARMFETKAELIRWIVAAGFLQIALIAALLIKLVKLPRWGFLFDFFLISRSLQ